MVHIETSVSDLIRDCDLEIRSGRPQEAVRQLVKLDAIRIERKFRLPLAQLCRRAGLYALGLKLLTPVIYPLHATAEKATNLENAEYAVLLLRNGAISEGIARLQSLDAKKLPRVLLYRSFGHFLEWEYELAAEDLDQYLRTPLEPRDRLLGSVNLAMALTESRQHTKALELLAANIDLAKELGHRQLQSTCHALRAQAFLQQNNFGSARRELVKAQTMTSDTLTNDNFLLLKCHLLLEGLETRNTAPMERLKELARKNRFWEACREADLYSLKIDFRMDRWLYLMVGTPFAGFRNLVRDELGHRAKGDDLVYILGESTAPRMDLQSGMVDGRRVLNPGKQHHQIINVLLWDFYQPLRIAALYSHLFPGQHFNISSSPDRVRQVIRRARRWLEHERIPVSVVQDRGFYSLRIDGPFSFRVPFTRKTIHPLARHLERLIEIFDRPFLAKEAESVLGLPKWTVNKVLRLGLERGVIDRLGSNNRRAKYKKKAALKVA